MDRVVKQLEEKISFYEHMVKEHGSDTAYYYHQAYSNALKMIRKEMRK